MFPSCQREVDKTGHLNLQVPACLSEATHGNIQALEFCAKRSLSPWSPVLKTGCSLQSLELQRDAGI